jgi:hypothetical protein
MELAERSQGMWDKGWQSATAGVLLVAWAVTLILLLRSQALRVRDREKADARMDRVQEKTEALARETNATVAETGKQIVVFSRDLAELRREFSEFRLRGKKT